MKAVAGYPLPGRKKKMRAFLSPTNYYKHFIPGYDAIAVPLNDAKAGSRPWSGPKNRRMHLNNSRQL